MVVVYATDPTNVLMTPKTSLHQHFQIKHVWKVDSFAYSDADYAEGDTLSANRRRKDRSNNTVESIHYKPATDKSLK